MSLDRWFEDETQKEDVKLLVDGHYVAYRTKGVPHLKKLKSNGRKTGVAYGTLNIIRKLIKEGYKDIEFGWDIGTPEHRYDLHNGYKDGRGSGLNISDDEINLTIDFLKYMGISQYWHPKLEADDVIASRCRQIDKDKVIYTTDKDYFQLLDRDDVEIKSKDLLINNDYIQNEYGIDPSQMVEYLALTGDDVDNIDGVKGVGDVTARKFINGEEISDNKLKNIEESESKIIRNKNLIRLRIVNNLECIVGDKNIDKFGSLLKEYEMESLYDMVELI